MSTAAVSTIAATATTSHVTVSTSARKLLSEDARKLLFTEARTHQHFLPIDVPEEKLKELYELWKNGPSAANTLPLRVLFIKSKEARERLQPVLMEGNRPKVATAPVTAILAYDSTFYEHIPRLAPPMAFYKDYLASNEAAAKAMAEHSAALQSGYFILAARAVGLDAGPMGGIDHAGVNKEFFESDESRKTWKAQMIVNLGYGDESKLYPRFPRFDFDEINAVI